MRGSKDVVPFMGRFRNQVNSPIAASMTPYPATPLITPVTTVLLHKKVNNRPVHTRGIELLCGKCVSLGRRSISMYCNYCGKVIPEDANLCAYCGKRVTGVVARKRLL